MNSIDDLAIAQALKWHFRLSMRDIPSGTAREAVSVHEMIEACAEVYGISPLQWVFHAMYAMALATECHEDFLHENGFDPDIIAVTIRVQSDRAPETLNTRAFIKRETQDHEQTQGPAANAAA